jgi:cyclopropane-fatty-acyl-phospholipid synthase
MRAELQTLVTGSPRGSSIDTLTRSLSQHIIRRSVLALLAGISRGGISIVDGQERFLLGPQGDPLKATIVVRDPSAYRAVLFGGSVGAGEAYVKGLWTCDDLPALARILTRNLDALDAMDGGPLRLSRRIRDLCAAAGRINTRTGTRRNIADHYDLSNELFGLFLDESMTYSSAVFERPDASLDEAQRAKIDRVCRKLDLGPRDRLLEIGTGWGALAIHAAREYGCKVTTTTVSKEQYGLAVERVRSAGLEGRVEVQQCDYRDLSGRYDKLVSIEMIEAVGHAYLDEFFRVCSERLSPDGLMLLQVITIADQHHERHRTSVDFIKRHIFPGSCLPSVTSMITSATRATDLRLSDLEDLTPHYARTLRIWRERFLGNVDEARRLGFDDAFVRMWEYYLAYCEGAFEERYLGCVHMLFTKPESRRPHVRPPRAP